MDEGGFATYLRRGGRSPAAVDRCLRFASEYERFLQGERACGNLDGARPEDLEAYVASIETKPRASAKPQLWALRYYYSFAGDEEMRNLAAELRQQRIKRTPFALGKFRGVNPKHAQRLAAIGIKNVEQMREAGRTPVERQALASQASIPEETVLELVKLSDLARIPGLKGIRARLYYDAGVDTLNELAKWEPEELRLMLSSFVERSGFDGIAPLPKEAAHAVATAQRLPRVIEY